MTQFGSKLKRVLLAAVLRTHGSKSQTGDLRGDTSGPSDSGGSGLAGANKRNGISLGILKIKAVEFGNGLDVEYNKQ